MKQDPATEQMFARLATEPKLREWLQAQLENEYLILVSAFDTNYLAKAQGRAGFLVSLIKRLDEARRGS